MDRRTFLGLSIGGVAMATAGISELLNHKVQVQRMPALFIGHGSPMNALAENNFTKTLALLGKKIPRPKAILMVSAHWMTGGTFITSMEKPKTIHDFSGFPEALFAIQYPALGNPKLASEIQKEIPQPKISLDPHQWGLDHGTWSVLRHMYPKSDIPVLQLSLNMKESHEYHFKFGSDLGKLRERGVLILGSGNIVHNLQRLKWDETAAPYDWALEFDEWSKEKIIKRDFKALQRDIHKTEAGKLSVPTMDHYYPLHYILGLANSRDEIKFEYEEIQNASISMRAVSVGMD